MNIYVRIFYIIHIKSMMSKTEQTITYYIDEISIAFMKPSFVT